MIKKRLDSLRRGDIIYCSVYQTNHYNDWYIDNRCDIIWKKALIVLYDVVPRNINIRGYIDSNDIVLVDLLQMRYIVNVAQAGLYDSEWNVINDN